MRKVRVLRDLPITNDEVGLVCIGAEIPCYPDGIFVITNCGQNQWISMLLVEDWIERGYLEWVEEESLAQKMALNEWDEEKTFWKLREQIASDHFKEKFDEACENEGADHSRATGWLNIRKALFGEE